MEAYLFRTPLTILFAGSSGAGKSQLVKRIVGRLEEVFDRPPKQIIICYGRIQTVYDEIKNAAKIPVKLVQGLPPDLNPPPRTLLIIDDLQEHTEIICDYFTKHSHHSDCDVIYITQNLFLKSAAHRTASLNAHVITVFKNPRDKAQVMCLERQVSPDNPKFIMDAYRQATLRPFGHLILNLKQDTPDYLRLRDSFFAKESHFYVDIKTGSPFDLGRISTSI